MKDTKMNTNDIVALGCTRTPIGRFGGTLKDVKSYELGAVAIKEALKRSELPATAISEVVFGNCRQAGNGPNPARTASLLAGIGTEVPANTLNMACPSGMKSIFTAASGLLSKQGDVFVAGGMDSMSTIPHMIAGLRFKPKKMGDLLIEDGWKDATDPYAETTMGKTALHIAEKYGISREEQDRYALESHKKAVEAMEAGRFDNETVPVELAAGFKHGPVSLGQDETPRPGTTMDRLATLPPAFDRNGPVTAGNSSAMSDGAAAMVLCTREYAAAQGVSPQFSIVSMAQTAVEGSSMGEGPTRSIPLALSRAGMELSDMDLIELNEAFASQVLANIQSLKLNTTKLNVNGGAIALGHPTGISGARIVVTLVNALKALDKELGLAAICGAGGVTTAMVIRREN